MRSIHPGLLVLTVLATGCSGGKLLLRYHPRPGTYRYTMQQTLKGSLSGGGAGGPALPVGEASIGGQFRQVVAAPHAGGVGVTWSLDTVMVSSPQAEIQTHSESILAGARGRLQAISLEIVYDDRMIPLQTHVNDPGAVGDENTPRTLRNAVHTFTFPLPVEPVGKGDEWRAADEFPLQGVPGASPIDVQYVLTVREIRIAGADTTIVIGIASKFPDTPLTMTEQGVTMQAKVTGTVAGQEEFDLTRGALASASMDGTIRVEMTAPQLRAPLAISLELHATLRRLGAT
jgi:hypothetical protein